MIRQQPNYRPTTEERSYGVSALMLVAMLKAEAAFNAVAITDAWKFEPPTSTSVPYVEIPVEAAIARVGGWSRRLDAKRAARRAARIDFEASVAVAGELNAASTYSDSPQEILRLCPRQKSR